MMATWVAVAQNKLTLKNVYEMITIPSHRLWPKCIDEAPSYALYLSKIEFAPPEEKVAEVKSVNSVDQFMY